MHLLSLSLLKTCPKRWLTLQMHLPRQQHILTQACGTTEHWFCVPTWRWRELKPGEAERFLLYLGMVGSLPNVFWDHVRVAFQQCSSKEIVIHRDDIIKEGFLVKQPGSRALSPKPQTLNPGQLVSKVQAHERMEKARPESKL